MLTPKQAFRAGFLLRCAEEGLDCQEIEERLNKVAELNKSAEASALLAEALQQIMRVPAYAGVAGIGLGAATGATLGHLAAPEDPGKLKRPPFLEDVQSAELAAAYRQQAADIRRRLRPQAVAALPKTPYGI